MPISSANGRFTFSNAEKSEIMGAKSQLLSGLLVAQRPTPHYFTFSLFHAPATSKLYMLWASFALRGSHAARS
jgi:hypothetical protein